MFIVNTSDNYELAETDFNMKALRLILKSPLWSDLIANAKRHC